MVASGDLQTTEIATALVVVCATNFPAYGLTPWGELNIMFEGCDLI